MTNPEDAIAYFTAQLSTYQNTNYAARFKTIITKFLAQIDRHKIDRNTIGVKPRAPFIGPWRLKMSMKLRAC